MGLLDGLFSDDPKQQAMMAMAMGLLGNQSGNFGQDVGKAGLLGQQAYAVGNERQQKAMAQKQEQEQRALQMQQLQAQVADQNRAREALSAMPDFSRPQLPNMAPTNENAQALANAPAPLPHEVMLKRAQYLDSKGLPQLSSQYYANADKLRPEVKEVKTVMQDGKPADLVLYKDGTHKLLPYGNATKMEFRDLGGIQAAIDPYSGSMKSTYAKSQTPDSIASIATTIRGQNMTDARLRDQNAIAAGGKISDLSHTLRKEFAALPEVKKYKEVIPVVESARKAPDTPAGDFALIYGVGKALDPESVVREGEMNMVIKAGSPAQQMLGYLNHIRGGGRLTAQMRSQLLQVLDQRAGEYASQYEAQKSTYTNIAEKSGVPVDQVLADIPSGKVKATEIPIMVGGKKTPAKLAPDGKYYVQIGTKPDGSARYAEVQQ